MLYIVKAISRRDFFDRRSKKGRGREITPIKVRLEAVSYQNFFQRQGVKRRRDSIFANLLLRTSFILKRSAQEKARRVRERSTFETRAGKTPKRGKSSVFEFFDNIVNTANVFVRNVGADRRDEAAGEDAEAFANVANRLRGRFLTVKLVDAGGEAEASSMQPSERRALHRRRRFDANDVGADFAQVAEKFRALRRNAKPDVQTDFFGAFKLFSVVFSEETAPQG